MHRKGSQRTRRNPARGTTRRTLGGLRGHPCVNLEDRSILPLRQAPRPRGRPSRYLIEIELAHKRDGEAARGVPNGEIRKISAVQRRKPRRRASVDDQLKVKFSGPRRQRRGRAWEPESSSAPKARHTTRGSRTSARGQSGSGSSRDREARSLGPRAPLQPGRRTRLRPRPRCER